MIHVCCMKVAGIVIWILSYLPHFFPFVVVVSIFSNNDHCNDWDPSRCFHALCETKTCCIISGSTWGVAGLTFHYSSNACWNWMWSGIWTRLQREHLVWKDWRRERNWLQEIFKSSLLWKAPKMQIYQKFVWCCCTWFLLMISVCRVVPFLLDSWVRTYQYLFTL